MRVDPKVGVILGGTRGIGLALSAALARLWGASGRVYLTARAAADGARVVAELAARGIAVDHLPFDLADPESPHSLAMRLKQRHGGVDVVVQNGAYMPRAGVPAAEDARPMIASNSHGTLRVLRAFLPILRDNGRMVVVASSLGVLAKLPHERRRSRRHQRGCGRLRRRSGSRRGGGRGLARLGQHTLQGRPGGGDARVRALGPIQRHVAGRRAHQRRQPRRHPDGRDA
jgi:NAD(P)-dependent dehydrogenase (short-subunit alcohol dehydrogenase family)